MEVKTRDAPQAVAARAHVERYISLTRRETDLLLTLGDEPLRLYIALKWWADFKTGFAGYLPYRPMTAERLASETGGSVDSVLRALDQLEASSLVVGRQMSDGGRIALELALSPSPKVSAGSASRGSVEASAKPVAQTPFRQAAPASDEWEGVIREMTAQATCSELPSELTCVSTEFNTRSTLSLSKDSTTRAAGPIGPAAPPAKGGRAFRGRQLAGELSQTQQQYESALRALGYHFTLGDLSLTYYREWERRGRTLGEIVQAAETVRDSGGRLVPLEVDNQLVKAQAKAKRPWGVVL